jgi:hypothetical protein
MDDQMHGDAGGCEHHADRIDQERHVVGDDGHQRMRRFEAVTLRIRVEDANEGVTRSAVQAESAVQGCRGAEILRLALGQVLFADATIIVAGEIAFGGGRPGQCRRDAFDHGQTTTRDTLWHGRFLAQGDGV